MRQLLAYPMVMCAIAGAGFGVWPILARATGLRSDIMMAIVAVLTAVPTTIAIDWGNGPMPSARELALGMGAALVNTTAFMVYSSMMGREDLDVAQFAPVVSMIIPVAAVIAGAMVLGEPMTARRWTGLAVAIVAVWLLNGR